MLLFDKEQTGLVYKIIVKTDGKKIAEYCMETVGHLSKVGERLLCTTLTLWGILDFCFSEGNHVVFPLSTKEQEYIKNTYHYCTTLYREICNSSVASVSFSECVAPDTYSFQQMTKQYYLGFTGGKDSTLCKLLLDGLKKDIVYYNVSYDDDVTKGEGRIFNQVYDQELYNRYTITGYKANSDLISFQQADDIHVTFIAPYLYEKEHFPSYLAVGLPYDAVHSFDNGIPDLVPTETFKSIRYLEQLMHSYGFINYKVVSPVASLHTFGIYRILENLIGIDSLMKLDSCWEANATQTGACGMCPKCQRLKYVFRQCFQMEYLSQAPLLKITSADFLFGSIHAFQLLQHYSPGFIGTHQFLHDDILVEQEFVEYIQNKFGFQCINLPNIEFVKDSQTWSDVLNEIIEYTGVDYRKLNDVADFELQKKWPVKYLPFEKYYNWGRSNPILCCYKSEEDVYEELNNG